MTKGLFWKFEFRIVVNGTTVEITINAETGEVIEIEEETEED